jgi:DNA alkylation damage repair protein AlkB
VRRKCQHNTSTLLKTGGLFIYPSLLPQQAQITLLEKLLHRDLSTFEHQTNVHLHHHIPELSKQNDESSASYFDRSSSKLEFVPKDPLVHKPFSTQQFLNKKLRWMTLGGQYDWTAKAYPSGPPPPFPPDIKHFVEGIFPMKAEAAIVNLYSPGNTLSLHRDVSEECDRPLVSISLGCEAIFVVGTTNGESDDQSEVAALRLKSGDAVLMSQGSRYAWHGVPRVLKDTCPEWLRAWPCEKNADHSSIYEHWRDWMSEKRVNINIRQMFE